VTCVTKFLTFVYPGSWFRTIAEERRKIYYYYYYYY